MERRAELLDADNRRLQPRCRQGLRQQFKTSTVVHRLVVASAIDEVGKQHCPLIASVRRRIMNAMTNQTNCNYIKLVCVAKRLQVRASAMLTSRSRCSLRRVVDNWLIIAPT